MVNKNKKLENQLKILEKSLNEDGYLSQYNSIKNELDVIYNFITKSIPIRSKCNWYKHSAKIKKKNFCFLFLNLEKQRGAQNTIKTYF